MSEAGVRGDIPDSWNWVRLGELGTWVGGGTPSKSNPEYWNYGRIPWISPKDVKVSEIVDTEDHITQDAVQASNLTILPPGSTVVVFRSGILNRVLPIANIAQSSTLNQDMKGIRPGSSFVPKYLLMALSRFGNEILRSASKNGTTVASIEFPTFLDFLIPLAPLAEQRRIVAEIERHFSRLDAAVAALERARVRLKSLRASILQAAVSGRLVPASSPTADQNNRKPDIEEFDWQPTQVTGGTRRRVQPSDENCAPVIPSGAGLSAGWAWHRLQDVASLVTDGDHNPPPRVSIGVPHLTAKNVKRGHLNLAGC